MKTFKQFTVKEFLTDLSQKKPVPGGGSVAALCGAAACGLLSMAGEYSLGKGKSRQVEGRLKKVVVQAKEMRDRFLDLADLDARAYLKVVKARSQTAKKKQDARKEAAAVPRETARLCRQALALTPVMVTNGNPYLLSDVEVAVELLFAAYKSAMINVRVNQQGGS